MITKWNLHFTSCLVSLHQSAIFKGIGHLTDTPHHTILKRFCLSSDSFLHTKNVCFTQRDSEIGGRETLTDFEEWKSSISNLRDQKRAGQKAETQTIISHDKSTIQIISKYKMDYFTILHY